MESKQDKINRVLLALSIIGLITAIFCFKMQAQTPDLTSNNFSNLCAINIVDNDSIVLNKAVGYNNGVLLQSGTYLRIKRFSGSTTFIHGYKALEEGDNYIKPVLVINKCSRGFRLNIDHNRILVYLGRSCRISSQQQILTLELNATNGND